MDTARDKRQTIVNTWGKERGPMTPALKEALVQVSTATLTLQLLKRGIRRVALAGVAPLAPGQERLVGPAYTLRFLPLREDLAHPDVLGAPGYGPRVAIEEAPAGSVMVIEARGVTTAGVIGDILAARLVQRGVAGLISDGAVRDGAGVRATGLPVWCQGETAPATLNEHAGGDIQVPVACGGVTILPGDIMVADGDGAIVIPAALAEDVAAGARAQERFEAWVQDRVAEGRHTIGLYPPNAETQAEYDAWLKDQE